MSVCMHLWLIVRCETRYPVVPNRLDRFGLGVGLGLLQTRHQWRGAASLEIAKSFHIRAVDDSPDD